MFLIVTLFELQIRLQCVLVVNELIILRFVFIDSYSLLVPHLNSLKWVTYAYENPKVNSRNS